MLFLMGLGGILGMFGTVAPWSVQVVLCAGPHCVATFLTYRLD